MKKTILLLSLICFTTNYYAQDTQTHHIGTSIGITTGIGISYRYWPSKLGIQITAAPLLLSKSDKIYSIGMSALYTLKDNEIVDLYSYVGSSILIETYSPLIYNAGVGIGFKFDFLKNLNYNIQFGYGANISNKQSFSRYGIVGETGLYYHF